MRQMPIPGGNQPTKQMPCRECGKPMTVNAQVSNPPRCFDCGLKAAVDQNRQMREKSGPYYDAWVARGRAIALGKGGGTPSD